jgi:serine/threonine-protein kinase
MVMEYLEGGDLDAWVRQRGAMPVDQAVEFVLQACEAIAEAHALGIVHRDLKPANLFCLRRADGLLAIKVLDFGISKLTGTDVGMTATSSVVGSPLYMSPEQMQSAKHVDTRTDIWSLGIILAELVTGRTPFHGETYAELVLKVVNGSPEPLGQARSDVPPAFERVVLRCLEKDRMRRYANVAELAQALAPFAPERALPSVHRIGRVIQTAGLGPTTPAFSTPSESESAEVSADTGAAWGQTASKGEKSRTPVKVAVAVAVVALVGGTAALVIGTHSTGPATGAAPPIVDGSQTAPLAATSAGNATPSASIAPLPPVPLAAPASASSQAIAPAMVAPGSTPRRALPQHAAPATPAAAPSSPGGQTKKPDVYDHL